MAAVSASRGDLGLIPAAAASEPWWTELEHEAAPKIIARLPFVERPDHPAALPVFVVSRVAPDVMVRETTMYSVRVSGWGAKASSGWRVMIQHHPTKKENRRIVNRPPFNRLN